jgi:hypothetical protein
MVRTLFRRGDSERKYPDCFDNSYWQAEDELVQWRKMI